jgi:hypothetical protein
MSSDQATPPVPCPCCRGRGWTFVRPRRHTAMLLIEGVPDSVIRADCLDCGGLGLAA